MNRFVGYLGLTVTIVLAVPSAGCNDGDATVTQAFDSKAWKAQSGHLDVADNPRGRMIRALQAEVLVMGVSRAEVLELLGPPDFTKETRDYYDLGRAPYGIDYEYFVVEYSKERMIGNRIERG